MLTMEYICDTLGNYFKGTCKANKQGIPNDGIFPKDGRNKQPRGTRRQIVKLMEKKVYFTAWQDNKPVHLLSTLKQVWLMQA